MLKKVGVIVGVIGIVLGLLFQQALAAEEVSQEWKKVINSFYTESCTPGSITWKGWEKGVKEKYDFSLKEMRFEVDFLSQEEQDGVIEVGIVLIIKVYVLDSNGSEKKIESVRGIIIFIDKESKEVAGVVIVITLPSLIINNWDDLGKRQI